MCFKFGKVEGADGIFLVFFMFSLRNSGWKSRPHPHRNSKLLHSKIIYILLSNRTNKQLHFRLFGHLIKYESIMLDSHISGTPAESKQERYE